MRNRYHQQIPGIKLIQIGAISMALMPAWTLNCFTAGKVSGVGNCHAGWRHQNTTVCTSKVHEIFYHFFASSVLPDYTDINLGHGRDCPASRAPITLDIWLEITKSSRKFLFHGFIWITNNLSPVPILLQAKEKKTMAQRGKQMRAGTSERFAYHSVKLDLLSANETGLGNKGPWAP
jgi:hypothetical protein